MLAIANRVKSFAWVGFSRAFLVIAVCLLPIGRAAAADLPIYADALASGWADWSWGSTRNLAATAPSPSP